MKKLFIVILLSVLVGSNLTLSQALAAESVANLQLKSPKVVTLADKNKTISMEVGQEFLLKLGEFYNWGIRIDHPKVISRVVNITVVRGAQGVYRAHRSGQATFFISGEPRCRKARFACALPSIVFKIKVKVLDSRGGDDKGL